MSEYDELPVDVQTEVTVGVDTTTVETKPKIKVTSVMLVLLFIGATVFFVLSLTPTASPSNAPLEENESVSEELLPPTMPPTFVEFEEGMSVTVTPAMLAESGIFYVSLNALVYEVLPPDPASNVIVNNAANPASLIMECSHVFCNGVSFAFFYEDRSIVVQDTEGVSHTMNVPQGGWRVNWWDVSNFLSKYSSQGIYTVLGTHAIPGSAISADLSVRPYGLTNLLVRDESSREEHNLYVVWPTSEEFTIPGGPIDGSYLVGLLLSNTTGDAFYLPEGANCLFPETQAIGHTSGACPEEDIRDPDWTSSDGQIGGTFGPDGKPMGVEVVDP